MAGMIQPGQPGDWRAAVEISEAWVRLHGVELGQGVAEGWELIGAQELAVGVRSTGAEPLQLRGIHHPPCLRVWISRPLPSSLGARTGVGSLVVR